MLTPRFAAILLAGAAIPLAPPAATDRAADPIPPLACTRTRFGHLIADVHTFAVATADTPDTARTTGTVGSATTGTVGSIGTLTVDATPEPTKSVRVQSPRELEDTLRSTFVGTVIVPKDVFWDMTGRDSIPIKSGVSLVGERGALCSRPSLFTNTHEGHDLFQVTANDVRIEGIHFRGPAGGSRSSDQPYVNGIGVVVDRAAGLGRRILVRDNEFDEWTGSGVEITSTMRARTPAQYDASWAKPTRADAELVRVEGNFMHHNARDGGGYGVTVGSGAYATIWGNVFNYNRHALASNGFAYTGYIARFNYILQGGFTVEGYWNQHFDVHGTNDTNGDDKSTGYGGTAGEYYEIAFNTIRGDQGYYVVKTRPAFLLRGKPTQEARFDGNVAVHEDLDAAVSLKNDKGDSGIGEHHDEFNFGATGNSFNTDRSGDMAVGDFDGDGRSDVFLASGTAWFVSRGGVEPWQFLHASTKRLAELGFADMDNDGITDVVYRAGNGDLGFLKSGAGAVLPLTQSPVAIKDLRFGDFDGDKKTDIFRREANGRWMIWYGRTRAWTVAQHSALALSALRFGEFDSIPGTDVVGILSDRWAVSSAATGSWDKLNDRLRRSFSDAVVADFNGDGKSDIAFGDDRVAWTVSYGGRGPIKTLKEVSQTHFKAITTMLIGRFDGDPSVEVAGYWDPYGVSVGDWSNHFVIWRGESARQSYVLLSRVEMR